MGSPDLPPSDPIDPLEPASKSQSVLNPKTLQAIRLMGGSKGSAVLKALLEQYLTDAPELLQQIKIAIQQSDPEMLRQLAHRFRSSSISLGAVNLSEYLRQLELLGKAGQLPSDHQLVEQVEQSYQRVKVALQQEIRNE